MRRRSQWREAERRNEPIEHRIWHGGGSDGVVQHGVDLLQGQLRAASGLDGKLDGPQLDDARDRGCGAVFRARADFFEDALERGGGYGPGDRVYRGCNCGGRVGIAGLVRVFLKAAKAKWWVGCNGCGRLPGMRLSLPNAALAALCAFALYFV